MAVLPRQWRRYRKQLQRCQRRFASGTVHDSRVETRRLLATLELLAAFVPERELKKPRRALREHLAAFDHLRDTQVQLGMVAPLRRTFPAAKQFHRWLRRREARFTREARQTVRHIKIRRLRKRIAALQALLRRQRKHTLPAATFKRAQAAIQLALARVGRLGRRVKAADPKSIHRTRIAFKRFRYMVEVLTPLLPGVTDKHRNAMRRYQAMMGEVQDLNVLLAALAEFIKAEEANDPATQRLRAEFVRRRERVIRGYIDAAPKLWLFWPPEKLLPRRTTRKHRFIP